MDKVQSAIDEVTAEIKKVEVDVEAARTRKDVEEVAALRKKEEQLRKEKEQLRAKELLLLERQQGTRGLRMYYGCLLVTVCDTHRLTNDTL
jgi:hypothetical protein